MPLDDRSALIPRGLWLAHEKTERIVQAQSQSPSGPIRSESTPGACARRQTECVGPRVLPSHVLSLEVTTADLIHAATGSNPEERHRTCSLYVCGQAALN